MIQLTIDGKQVHAEEGSMLIRAARSAGINIPSLCDHPALPPSGECDLCLVEIQGEPELCLSCTLPVRQGMVVKTNSESLRAARISLLSKLFSQRSHICPTCQASGGDCQLQNAAYQVGMTHWPLLPDWIGFSLDTSHPKILLDNNHCTLCQLCVRACLELVGNATLSIQNFGAKRILVADDGLPLGESSCVSCGTCLEVCPTGALIDQDSAYLGLETQLSRTSSICIGCSLGCGIQALTRDGRLVRIEGHWQSPVNEGLLCQRGRFKSLHRQEKRLESPMLRIDGQLKSVSWSQAFDFAASKLSPLLNRADGVAALVSTRLPLEDLVIFEGIFRQGFGSTLVTSIEEGFTQLSGSARSGISFFPFEGKLEELKHADAVIVIGASFYEYHEVAGFFIKRMVQNGGCLVLIDPRENPLDAFSRHLLRSQSCKDAVIMQALIQALNQAVIGSEGSKYKLTVENCDIPGEKFLAAAGDLSKCKRVAIVYGKGITTQDDPANLAGMLALSQALENKSGRAAAMISVKGKANSLVADQLKLVQKFRPSGFQAAYIALGDDHPGKRQMRFLQELPLVITQASYHSALTEISHIIFPVSNWYETEGIYLNLEGRLQKSNSILPAPDGIRSNRQVFESLAEKLGLPVNYDWRRRLLQDPCVVNLDLDQASAIGLRRVLA